MAEPSVFVDWSGVAVDPGSAAAVAALETLAAGFDTKVPAVLLPVRVETRFTTVVVPDLTDHLQVLLDRLEAIRALLKRLAGRPYATQLTGRVSEQREIKSTVEQPLYAGAEADLAALRAAIEAVRLQLLQPVTTGTPDQQRRLTAMLKTLRAGFASASTALGGLRSAYQRERLGGELAALTAAAEEQLRAVERQVRPTLRLVAELGITTATEAAGEVRRSIAAAGVVAATRAVGLGRAGAVDLAPGAGPSASDVSTSAAGLGAAAPGAGPGRPVAGLGATAGASALAGTPDAGVAASAPPRRVAPAPPRRVVVDDGTGVAELGATRALRLDPGDLVGAAAAAEAIRATLADPTAPLGDDLQAAAAGIAVLPGALKADLLARLNAAAGRPGAAAVLAEIAATPSDRPDLDVQVPERAAGAVFVVPGPTRQEHQLLVRIYPEQLAVDTHEEELTDLERADGAAFWTETAAAGTNEELRKGAWRALCIGRSTRRAAWIVRVTEPVAPAQTEPTPGAVAAQRVADALTALEKRLAAFDPPTGRDPLRPRPARVADLTDRQLAAVARALEALDAAIPAADALPEASMAALTARLRAALATVAELANVYANVPGEWATRLRADAARIERTPVEAKPEPTSPDVGSRSGTWTRAASSTVLPTRFAVFTVDAGRATHVAAGGTIPADLKLGLDPVTDTFTVDDGDLVVPDSIRWLTDFDEAVAKGMALRMTISASEAERGFDELIVVGLADGGATDGQERLTAMLDAHHHTGDGLALLPIGTATNNTEDQPAGASSADDPDAAYPVERGPSLVAATSDGDGARLAAALGVDADVLAHVAGADGSDGKDAQLANRVLYPGTVGHALDELASQMISRDARERLRAYALGHVAGRGMLPAIRVGQQPYGLLPAVALGDFTPDLRDSGTADAPAATRQRQLSFEQALVTLFRRLHEDWSEIRAGAPGRPGVKHANSPEIGMPGFDAQQHFLAMLGLEPTSVESSYRFAVNVADRGGVRGHPDLALAFGVPSASGAAGDPTADFGPFALLEHLAEVFRMALGLPTAFTRQLDGTVTADWQRVLDRVTASRAYQLRLLDGLHTLRGAVAVAGSGGGTGQWLRNLLNVSADDLRARTEQDLDNVGLTEILVRHALLAELRRAAAAALVDAGLLTDDRLALLGTSTLFETWSDGDLTQTSAWGLLFTSVNRLAALGATGAAIPAGLANRTMAEVLAAPRPADIVDHRTAVTTFSSLPPERMSALTREHLDLCAHRLDAWLTGLAQRRLTSLRATTSTGAQVGAYGWVHDLRPAPAATPATGVPAALAGRPGRPLIADPSREGFIQTPSPTHAVTAAILRAAYRSQVAEGSLGNEMSINLSSSRVRTALGLIDGVRAGNDLGALLGYQLERFLHEYYARPDTPHVVELDSTIFPLRRAYPTVAAVDADADSAVEPTRFVVDGLALVRTMLDWVATKAVGATGTLFDILMARQAAYPWDVKLGALPELSDTPKLIGVLRGVDAIADALDALGDLATSETVHQLVRGNHVRAAAVLAALSEGTAMPRPEVADTPRSGLPVSHRLLLQLPAVPATPLAAPAGWEAAPVTPRAALEPAVNGWLAALLGDPAAIRARLTSDSLAPGVALPELSIAALGLQPLDLVALLADGFDVAVGALTARVLDHLRPADLPPDQPGVVVADGAQTTVTDAWRIESQRAAAWGPAIRGITDVAPLLETCADLLGAARPALAADYAAPESTATAGEGVDLADLATRGQRLLDDARADAVALARLLAEDAGLDATVLDTEPAVWLAGLRDATVLDADQHPSAWLPRLDLATGTPAEISARLARLDGFWAQRDEWRAAATVAQAYGIRVGLSRRFLSRTQVSTELLQSVEVAYTDLAGRCRAAAATLAAATAGGAAAPASSWTQVAKDVLGESVILVPRVTLDPVLTELQSSFDAGLAGPDELDAWLEGVAAVRPGAARLADLQLLGEALGRPATPPAVAQLPSLPGEPWLGGALADPAALAGRVSVVVVGRAALPAAGASGPALVLDEWSEQVPYREETTGVAVHYDQPDATAPQAILLAVPAVRDRPWSLAAFAATLHDTLEIARNRTVELEHLGASRYGQLLPLLVGEVVPNAVAGAGDRVILDFHQNNP